MTLLLMAAGSGSRYGKLKQFDDLGPNGEFLMEFGIYDALKNGFDHIVLITKKENVSLAENHLRPKLPANIKLDVLAQEITDLPEGCSFSGERKKPWGTAHAVWTARNVINGPFAVLNADDFYGQSAYENAANFAREHNNDNTFALVGYTLKNTLSEHGSVSRGVCQVNGDDLISVDERLKLEPKDGKVLDLDSGNEYTGEEQVSMNFWVCQPSIFDKIESEFRTFLADDNLATTSELYIPKTVQEMLQAGEIKVKVVPSGGDWFGVTYASDREKAVANLQGKTDAGKYPSPLWPKQ
ncbi:MULTISPECIES: sugar phosphate nucleotidyltransferase [Zobellia]|uniref:nucleotidyltransferase family protein n=1 Tax=Zobellia TaxID=112040 RepID=UPI001BFF77E3|nr:MULTISPECIES: sugar phosphate nucleotidyltransferase [Zobellia]MBT9188137.1 UTP--glucose-1-phosphate uridylyltransferase [Zobellia russellii]MBU2974429.1 UTP--glucose-1-phosphate uridylyltransferase [Zobellia sp. B3R18]MDO6818521.1 sugar phosphate nucleotidyltransferase [Zobellia sp. 1_MG-2023]